MTDTTTAEPEYGTDHQEDAQAPLGGTLEHLDPTSLVLGENVREYPNLKKPFLDSIAEHGVLVPLTAIRRHDGAVEVRNGSLSSSRVVVDPCGAAECCRGCDRTR